MPGQNLGPDIARPGTSESNAMVTTTGRYVVQKAELSSLFFYYMLQGNYNLFNKNEIVRDDVSQEEFDQISEMSSMLNYFVFGPIDEEGVVPDAWKVPQPMSGLTIYEPTSFLQGARNQAEMVIGLATFAEQNLCVSAGCEIEEAAARLGYAAWNLDKAFQRQLAEAASRREVDDATHGRMASRASSAAASCRAARGQLLARQPRLPDEQALSEAAQGVGDCLTTLRALVQGIGKVSS